MNKWLIAIIVGLQVNISFGQSKYPLPTRNQNLDNYLEKTIWVKVKPAYKSIFEQPKNNARQLSKLSNQLNGISLRQIFSRELAMERNQYAQQRRALPTKRIDLSNYYEVKVGSDKNIFDIIKTLEASGMIEYADPVRKLTTCYRPNDPQSDSLTNNGNALAQIHAFDAWNIEKGDSNVTIAISDLGADYNHIDLKNSIQYNYNDTIDGVDNDNDGYTDNFRGWDLGQNDSDVMSDPNANPHGTMVSGLAAATADNDTLITGTGFKCKFLPLKIASNGAIIQNAAYNSLIYAGIKGCKVINLSWGGAGSASKVEQDFINAAVLDYDMVVVGAAGNTGSELTFYPASYDNVLSVTGLIDDKKWQFSSFSKFVDLAAPTALVTTFDGNNLKFDYGTSLSAPIVSGAVALIRSKFPQLNALQIMELVRLTGDIIDTIPDNIPYKGKIGRKLNMYSALTKSTPAVKMVSRKVLSSNGDKLMIGDTIKIVGVFKNLLAPTQNLKINVSTSSPYITIYDSVIHVGMLDSMDSLNIGNSPIRFEIKANTPILSNAEFIITYEDGDYVDKQYFTLNNLNIDFLDLDTNKILCSISSGARIGFSDYDGSIGSGFKYNNSGLLFEGGLMLANDKGKLSDCVRNGNNTTNKKDFSPIGFVKYAKSQEADRMIINNFRDTGFYKLNVEVLQKSFAWNSPNKQNFIILEYRIKNISGENMKKVHAALFADWDIPAVNVSDANYYAKNKVIWDSINTLGIAYNSNATGLYSGMKLLTPQEPIFYALENSLISNGFSDNSKYFTLTRGVGNKRAGSAGSGTDVSEIFGATLYDLDTNETQIVAIALIAGSDILEIQNTATLALSEYKKIRTSPTPVLGKQNYCFGSNAEVSPSGGKTFNFYKSLPLVASNKIVSGSSVVIPNIESDTNFYITNTDSVFESNPVLANVNVVSLNGDFSYVPTSTPGNFQFKNSTKNSTNWFWSVNDSLISTNQSFSIQFDSNANYPIQLILTDNNGCKDTVIKEVKVSNIITFENDDVISNGINIAPNPSNDILNITTTNKKMIEVSIENIIGVVVIQSNGMEAENWQIAVGHLPSGIYLANIKMANKSFKVKFVISH